MQTTRLPYNGSALPAIAETVVLLDTTLVGGHNPSADRAAGAMTHLVGVRWFVYSIWHDESATLNGYFKTKKADGDLTAWRQFYSQSLVPGSLASLDEVLVEPYEHVKFEVVNGGTAQTAFEVNAVLSNRGGSAS
jgi:hypothetical protein